MGETKIRSLSYVILVQYVRIMCSVEIRELERAHNYEKRFGINVYDIFKKLSDVRALIFESEIAK